MQKSGYKSLHQLEILNTVKFLPMNWYSFFVDKLKQPAEMMLSRALINSKVPQSDERSVLIYAHHKKDCGLLKNKWATKLLTKQGAKPTETSMPYQAWKFGGDLDSEVECIIDNTVFDKALLVGEKKLAGRWQLS